MTQWKVNCIMLRICMDQTQVTNNRLDHALKCDLISLSAGYFTCAVVGLIAFNLLLHFFDQLLQLIALSNHKRIKSTGL